MCEIEGDMAVYGYARVSTDGQSLVAQLAELRAAKMREDRLTSGLEPIGASMAAKNAFSCAPVDPVNRGRSSRWVSSVAINNSLFSLLSSGSMKIRASVAPFFVRITLVMPESK